jgi:hypothetical protein
MASFFRRLFDEVIDALGGGYDKPPQTPPQTLPQPPSKADALPPLDAGQQCSFYGYPIDPATDCRVCGIGAAKPEYYNQFCSYKCEQRMADSMDAWHDQFQERFGDD